MFFKRKIKELPKERLTITTQESISLEHKASGRTFTFSVGKDDNGTFYALTDPEQRPKFCFTAESYDEAATKGVDAINYYIENHLI